jgi:S1-C subfamily serine protease
MKKSIVLAVLLFGCAPKERYVSMVPEAVSKTVSLTITGTVLGFELVEDETGISARPVRKKARSICSGVFVSPSGHVLTCDHCVDFDEVLSIQVETSSDWNYRAELLFKEPRLDLAILKVEPVGVVPYAHLADPRALRVGQEVVAIGSPLGFPFSVSHGIISALNVDGLGVYNMTQSDAFINPGNSGGPLFNLKGELVGINSRMVPPVGLPVFTGLGFSVQSGQIVEFLTRFRGIDSSIPPFGRSYWKRVLYALGLGKD